MCITCKIYTCIGVIFSLLTSYSKNKCSSFLYMQQYSQTMAKCLRDRCLPIPIYCSIANTTYIHCTHNTYNRIKSSVGFVCRDYLALTYRDEDLRIPNHKKSSLEYTERFKNRKGKQTGFC